MKNIKIVLFLLSLVLVSCETNYDDIDENREPIVRVTGVTGQTHSNVLLPVGGSATIEIGLFVSTVSDTDKTYTIVVVDETTEIGPENYVIGQGLIPANSATGTFNVTFTDVSIGPDFKTITLKVSESSEYISGASRTLNVRANQ